MTRSISAGAARPASALPPAATAMSTTVSSAPAIRRLGDADPAADPLVVGVHHLGEVVVGDHVRRAGSAPRPRIRAPGTARLDVHRASSDRAGYETGQRLARVDQVAVVQQPLGQHAVVRGAVTSTLLALGADRAEPAAGPDAGALGDARPRLKVPPAGATTTRQSGVCSAWLAAARAGRSGRGRRPGRRGCSAVTDLDAGLSSRLASPASVPAGGSSITAVTPRSRRVRHGTGPSAPAR